MSGFASLALPSTANWHCSIADVSLRLLMPPDIFVFDVTA
jgi:hypothetical protein